MPEAIHVTETGETKSIPPRTVATPGGLTPDMILCSSHDYEKAQVQQNARFASDIDVTQNEEVAAITRNNAGNGQLGSQQYMTEVAQAASNTVRHSSDIV